ncbi:hypothetical protein NC653_032288 [Populus alba x Populus x berolinensis]|uniref:alpha-amylase n=1 Tax=Populus alba x Populus x berolinensis TaxID=444605 RepID=A0AAD6LR04_9ROSI|nr:hypothetical protein NC653_032288 [Populus alba x Populus x berolinensis]
MTPLGELTRNKWVGSQDSERLQGLVVFPLLTSSYLLFQGFNWESCNKAEGWYNSLKNSVPDLANAGITHVWLPPSSQSVAPQGYMPDRLYDLSASRYGSQDELKSLIGDLKQKGIKCLADIGPSFICGDDTAYSDGKGNPDSGDDFEPAPDIDHLNPRSYDHFFDWGLKEEIGKLATIRKNYGIGSASTVNILASDADLYVAAINDNLTMKIGPKTDLGNLIPSNFQVATSGTDHCVNQRQKGNSETGSASPKLHIIRPKTSEELRKYTSMVWMFFSRPSQCQSQALEEGNPIGNLLKVHIVNNIAPLNIPQ